MGMKGKDIADVDTGRAFVESNFVVYVESGVLNSTHYSLCDIVCD